MGPKENMGLKEAYLANREAELKEWDAKILQLEAKAEQAQAQVKILLRAARIVAYQADIGSRKVARTEAVQRCRLGDHQDRLGKRLA
jgi:multidrug resistance efflux pump